jgi:acyl-coenzyme A synthetase/AMP-(fatty) acid ligase
MPGFELSHDFFPQPGDRIWTPADWAWIGGLYDVVMPALAHGMPVVAYRARRFDPEQAFDLIARAGIRNVFMPATALRMMRRAGGAPVSLRTLASGGETVGEETADALAAKVVERARALTVGPGADPQSEMGPVITAEARERVASYVGRGAQEGAELALDGRDLTVPGHEDGFFLGGCLFSGRTAGRAAAVAID